ncbi:leukocyte receptor cluster member 1 [Triplophysa rosa]|uniref:Leukocyte receptor cluster member 1 n=1 Tax=Triplophysa rosa TaxID=992332 RepID=A0A9W7WQM2_TRIRA|nr:leukocyte receptor cluster member 1 [Triplophysa rosa]KAI7806523.1 leukocyte receptor cluster member 1 [Triplophysa rosa]
MNILPKKSWHVRNKDNIARVRRDEAGAAEEEREIKRRIERAEQEARTDYLRKKARGALPHEETEDEETAQTSRGAREIEHLNLFPIEDSAEKKGNAEYLKEKKEDKEKQERAIGLLVSLGPAPGTEATPWYLKDRKDREEESDKKDKHKTSQVKKQQKSLTEEEREKKDRKLKDRLDPLKDMKKALAVKDRKEKNKKKYRAEKRSGDSSIERLRAERLQREAEERKKTQALLDQKSGGGKEKQEREMGDRDRPYNSAYFPELARKRQRRDGYQNGFY